MENILYIIMRSIMLVLIYKISMKCTLYSLNNTYEVLQKLQI